MGDVKDDNTAEYRFRMIDQSASYQLTATDVIIGCRRGLQSSSETIPLTSFDGRRSSWEYTSVPWIGMAVISVLAVIFGVWGLLSPKETGMYAAVAIGLITTGLLLPVCLWKHRRLSGVTFTGAHGYTVSSVGSFAHGAIT